MLGVLIGLAAWYKPDFWKATVREGKLPAGSEWREGRQKDSFTFVSFDILDSPSTHPTGINDNGDIVGNFSVSAGRRCFLRKPNSEPMLFDYPGASFTTNATGINNKGDIVGFYYDASITGRKGSPAHGFLRRADGIFESFDYPGTWHTFAHAVNDTGQVVGVYEDDAGVAHGFLRNSDGSFVPVEHPEGTSTAPFGINNQGEVVGYWRGARTGDRGFLRQSNGRFISIEPDPTTSAYPRAINDNGTVVGYTGLGTFLRRKDGTLSLLDHPACFGGACTMPTGINKRGEVVGQYQVSGEVHGFLAKPVQR